MAERNESTRHIGGHSGASKRLIDATDLAHTLSVSLRQVWRLRATGEIPAPVRVGSRSVRWRASDIDRYLAALGK
jgi:predicted DNA-binding transcriptional regulator AlpA